jgi:hypothetical protein
MTEKAKITKVSFEDKMLVVSLSDGGVCRAPVSWFPKLAGATQDQKDDFRIISSSVYWPRLDQELDYGLLSGNNDSMPMFVERLEKEVSYAAERVEVLATEGVSRLKKWINTL